MYETLRGSLWHRYSASIRPERTEMSAVARKCSVMNFKQFKWKKKRNESVKKYILFSICLRSYKRSEKLFNQLMRCFSPQETNLASF